MRIVHSPLVVASSARRGRLVSLGLGVLAGAAITIFLMRSQLRALVLQAASYARRPSQVSHPALIINRWSGDGRAVDIGLADASRNAGIRVIMLERGNDISQLAHDAIDAGADAIGAAGGDGSLGLVAGVAVERDVPFFCIPVGTRNHFALDVGLDRDDPLTALDAVRNGDEILVDYGLAGDRLFLNNVSFGVYAEAVHRAEYRENKEHTIVEVMRGMHAGEDGGSAIRFTTPEGYQAERTAMTMVSNNPYMFSGPPDYGRRLRLDAGLLGISTAAAGTTVDGAAGSGVRRWEAVRLRLESEMPILAGLDGEALTFGTTLDLVICPRGLRILVPAGTKPGYVPRREALVAELIGLARLAGVPGSDEAHVEG